jgi:hypothetical protein
MRAIINSCSLSFKRCYVATANGKLLSSMLVTWTLALLLHVALSATTTGTTCGPEFNFFPPKFEEAALPTAWRRSAQTDAGNEREDELFNVVLTSSHNLPGVDAVAAAPVLYVLPRHPMLIKGATVSTECMGYGVGAAARSSLGVGAHHSDTTSHAGLGPAMVTGFGTVGTKLSHASMIMPIEAAEDEEAADAAASRRLAEVGQVGAVLLGSGASPFDGAAAAGSLRHLAQTGGGTVKTPARYSLSYTLAGRAVSLGEFKAGTPAKLELLQLADMPDGYFCMSLKATVLSGSGEVGSTPAPVVSLHTTTSVCFYKLDAPMNATIVHTSCDKPCALLPSTQRFAACAQPFCNMIHYHALQILGYLLELQCLQ